MKKISSIKICLFLFFLQGIIINRQLLKAQNLVPNHSFETFSLCLPGAGKIYSATNWFQPRKIGNASVNQSSSSDYYNSCATNPFYSVPNNFGGFQYAQTGNAYIGIGVYEKYNPNYREYAEVGLTMPLEEAKHYKLEFYASLICYSRYAIKQLDACFTSDSLFDSTVFVITSVVPQIQNNTIISDTMNWVKVSGSFTANGGENFLTIGNFQPDSLTDTLAVVNNPANYFNGAYYYIDDVSLTLYSTAGVNELSGKENFSISPNPANESFNVKSIDTRNKEDEFVLYSTIGEAVLKKKITEREQVILTEGLPNGMYYWQCGGSSGKLAIVKDN